MARRPEDPEVRPHPRWLERLRRLVDEHGITPKDAHVTNMTRSRLFNLPGQARLRAANRYAAALRARGVDVPPPVLEIVDADEYHSIIQLRALRSVDEAKYTELLEIIRRLCESAVGVVDEQHKLRDLVETAAGINVTRITRDGEK